MFEILLARYSGSTEIVVGTPVAGRKRPELQNLIGFFVNTIALHTDLDDDLSFSELLERVKNDSVAALANDELPFEKLVEELSPDRDPSYSPIFQVMFVLHHGGSGEVPFGDLRAESVVVDSGTAKFDLTLFVTETDGNISLLFEYNTDLFAESTIERMLVHFQTLLRSVISNPDTRISEVGLLDATERDIVVNEFNNTAQNTDYVCIHELVETQVEQTPDRIAVEFGNTSLTYKELNDRANSLAEHLRSLGGKAGSKVVISMERSIELPVAALAVLKAGACYVPVDPHYPEERIQAMLEDCNAEIILTKEAIETFDFSGSASNPAPGDPEHPAYCIYTSGSTGKPKGVELRHSGLCNLLQWQNQDQRLKTPARTLQFASFSFDVHFQEFFGTWSNGGTTVMVTEELRQDLTQLADFIAASHIERLFLPYAALQPIAENLGIKGNNPYLKDIVVAGEQLQVSPAIRKLYGLLDNAALHNQYGPSQSHVVTALTMTGDPESWPTLPTIGKAIANTHCYVLDQNGTPCPVGIPGELYLGGAQVAIGYLNRSELNAEKFISSPFIDGDRLYRTGDRVRYLNNGEIEFLGRADDQLKWRGYRIEPGEIEARLTDQPDVQQAIVLLREDTPGDKRLVGYVMGDAPDEHSLRLSLKEGLPEYMVPGIIVVLDELPLTPSGKVARRRLPAPEYSRNDTQPYVAPRNETEQKLAGLWAEILSVEQIGVHDDFFQLGGHSLLAMRLIARIRAELDAEVPLIDLFSNPSVAEFAALLSIDTHLAKLPAIQTRNSASPAPLSFAQQRLWFLDQLDPGNPVYNFPIVLNLKGDLDRKALQSAIDDLIARHDALRTCFETTGNTAVQVVSPEVKVELQQQDCSSLSTTEQREHINRLVQQGFDLTKPPLMHVHLLQVSEHEHTLVLVTHHIVSDGWSLGIMMRELGQSYSAHSTGADYQPVTLAVQYSDYAAWQREWFSGEELQRQLDYWRIQLQDAPPVLDLPTDKTRPAEQSFNGSSLLHYLPADLQTDLEQLAAANNCTLYMVLLATFNVLLARYSGDDQIVVGPPLAGRRLSELEDLIGFFSNTLALSNDLSGDPSFTELLERTRTTTLDAYAHQDLPFEKLVEELQPERDMSHTPIFQVMLVMQNEENGQPDFGELELSYPEFEMGIAKFDLLLEVATSTNGMRTGLQFNTDLFESTTIARMLTQFETLLRAVTARSDTKLSGLSLLDQSERETVVEKFNDTDTEFDAVCVHRMVEAQAARTPETVAVSLGKESLTYSELNNRANLLGAYLRNQDAGPGAIVAISLERSLELPVALLAVLKSGACYVPVDPNYPSDRITAMLDDSNALILLTTSGIELPAITGQRIDLDRFDFTARQDNLDGGDINDPLYCIYTSGSTGKPKGVQLSHAG
ncbi:MAG: amino acid adenylation domain-containing protein, partial [Gammaproteobacteria bacterium]